MPSLPSNDAAIARSAGNRVGAGAVERGASTTGLGFGAGMNTGARFGGGALGAETQAEMTRSEIRAAQRRITFIGEALMACCAGITPHATNDSETAMD
jgi:hypothetical protein